MNWKLILALSAFGAAMGVISLFGYTQGIELYLWLGIAIVCTVLLAKRTGQKRFLQGLVLVAGVVYGLFLGVLAWLADKMTKARSPAVGSP